MQAIIPVAGAGTRLRPLTYTQPKVLILVAGKPILSYIIDGLIANKTSHFIFVIGYLGEKIKEFVAKNYPDIKATFVHQENQSGLGNAIWCAKEFVNFEDDLIIQLGDTIIDVEIDNLKKNKHSTLCIKKVFDPRMFGVAELNEDGTIKFLIEKPQIPKSNMALVGYYFIKEPKALFDALAYNIKNNLRINNEFYLTDALQRMLQQGVVFDSFKVEHWFDVGKKDILLETNAILLRKNQAQQTPENFENTILIPPYHIGKGVKIKNSIIGPYTTIADNATIHYSLIKNSIVGNFTKLENVVLENSLIGSDSAVSGFSQSLNIGDNTEIDLSGKNN